MLDLDKIFSLKNKKIINIVIEGLDRSGKSSVSKQLYNHLLKSLNPKLFKVLLYNHPNSKICKEEREFLLNNIIAPTEETKIFIECKNKLIDHILNNIDEEKININIIDRWTHSTFVYQNMNLYNNTNILINDEIINIINNDNYKNKFNIDFVIYLDLKYVNFKNRGNKNINNREKFLDSKLNFSLSKKLYDKVIKDNYLNLHENKIIINSNINNIAYKVLTILNHINNLSKGED